MLAMSTNNYLYQVAMLLDEHPFISTYVIFKKHQGTLQPLFLENFKKMVSLSHNWQDGYPVKSSDQPSLQE